MLRYGQDYVDEGEKVYEARFAAPKRLSGLADAAKSLGYTLLKRDDLDPKPCLPA
jgi:hypothetical protein